MPDVHAVAEAATRRRGRDVILAATSGRIELVGTLDSLARGLKLPVPDLEEGLCELLEAEQIAVEADLRGRLTITQPWQPHPPSDDELAAYRNLGGREAARTR